MLYIRFKNHSNCKEHLKYFLVCLVQLIDNIITVGTLGFVTSCMYRKLLFSDWLEKE